MEKKRGELVILLCYVDDAYPLTTPPPKNVSLLKLE